MFEYLLMGLMCIVSISIHWENGRFRIVSSTIEWPDKKDIFTSNTIGLHYLDFLPPHSEMIMTFANSGYEIQREPRFPTGH